MSRGIGIGAAIQGMFSGYSFGEDLKDKKRIRERQDRLDAIAEEQRGLDNTLRTNADARAASAEARTQQTHSRTIEREDRITSALDEAAARTDAAFGSTDEGPVEVYATEEDNGTSRAKSRGRRRARGTVPPATQETSGTQSAPDTAQRPQARPARPAPEDTGMNDRFGGLTPNMAAMIDGNPLLPPTPPVSAVEIATRPQARSRGVTPPTAVAPVQPSQGGYQTPHQLNPRQTAAPLGMDQQDPSVLTVPQMARGAGIGAVMPPQGDLRSAPPPVEPQTIPDPGPQVQITYDEWKAMGRSEREAMGLPLSQLGFQNHPNMQGGVLTMPAPAETMPTQTGPAGGPPVPQTSRGITPPAQTAPPPQDPRAPSPRTNRNEPDIRVGEPNTAAVAETIAEIGTAPSTTTLSESVAQTPAATPQQAVQAAKSWTDHYREVGAPYMQEQLLRMGMVEEAQAYGDWIQAEETRAGLDAYGYAAHAAARGDMDGFARAVIDLYNNEDYYPDGLTVDEENSRFVTNKDGDIIGAELAFTDAEGQTYVETWEGMDDLLQDVLNLLAPEKAFEIRLEQQKAAQEIAAERAEAAVEAQRKSAEDYRARVGKIVEALADPLAQTGFNEATPQERQAMIQERLQAEDAVVASMLPQATPQPQRTKPGMGGSMPDMRF